MPSNKSSARSGHCEVEHEVAENAAKDEILDTPKKVEHTTKFHSITTPPSSTEPTKTVIKRVTEVQDSVCSELGTGSPKPSQPKLAKTKAASRRNPKKGCQKVSTLSVKQNDLESTATGVSSANQLAKTESDDKNESTTVKEVVVNGECNKGECTKSVAARKQKTVNVSQQQTKLTEFFPVRRSSRMTTTELKKREDDQMVEFIRSHKQDGLMIKEFPDKGRGVLAVKPFAKGEFVVEYAGELIDPTEAKIREKEYGSQGKGCYMYYFVHHSKNYCVDATPESEFYGRLINHSQKRFNCATRVVEVGGQPHLILVASRDIAVDEELLYDYGDRSKESLVTYPWLAD